MIKPHQMKLSNWDYGFEEKNSRYYFYVEPDKPINIPKILGKYYGLNKYSIDAITNSYFYGAHPNEFNDLFDCSEHLLSFENLTLDQVKFFAQHENPSEIEKLYHSSKRDAINLAIIGYRFFTLSRLGILSLTENFDNFLMWAYYTNHRGFIIKFDYSEFDFLYHGPFPINYTDNIKPYDITYNIPIGLIYQTNIKSKIWSHESEWRILLEKNNTMKYPDMPAEIRDKAEDRKFNYNPNIIKSLILGYAFFPNDFMIENRRHYKIFKFDKSLDNLLRMKLLDFSMSKTFDVSIIHKKNDISFEIRDIPIEISKIDEQIYKWKYY
jgi:hypothetical protein